MFEILMSRESTLLPRRLHNEPKHVVYMLSSIIT